MEAPEEAPEKSRGRGSSLEVVVPEEPELPEDSRKAGPLAGGLLVCVTLSNYL